MANPKCRPYIRGVKSCQVKRPLFSLLSLEWQVDVIALRAAALEVEIERRGALTAAKFLRHTIMRKIVSKHARDPYSEDSENYCSAIVAVDFNVHHTGDGC